MEDLKRGAWPLNIIKRVCGTAEKRKKKMLQMSLYPAVHLSVEDPPERGKVEWKLRCCVRCSVCFAHSC
ncbi:hypothetical protein AMECASPLE_028075 [Ameca splendens]|uniref:DUF5641 domain-containing protein n=1 Tax=Ameca splendens TaxID=208324 RepID=A0ABV0YSF1_9TELE